VNDFLDFYFSGERSQDDCLNCAGHPPEKHKISYLNLFNAQYLILTLSHFIASPKNKFGLTESRVKIAIERQETWLDAVSQVDLNTYETFHLEKQQTFVELPQKSGLFILAVSISGC
jgi:hypothetical protein